MAWELVGKTRLNEDLPQFSIVELYKDPITGHCHLWVINSDDDLGIDTSATKCRISKEDLVHFKKWIEEALERGMKEDVCSNEPE